MSRLVGDVWLMMARERHKPGDPDAVAAEVRRLRSTGLTPRDIADALRLSLGEVLDALAATPTAPSPNT